MKRILGLAVLAAGLALCTPAGAVTIPVTTVADELDGGFGDTGCSLREAVQAANQNAPFENDAGADCPGDAGGLDTILLQGGLTYPVIRDGTFGDLDGIDDDNTDGDLDIAGGGGITIRAVGSGLATIDAGNQVCPCPMERVIEFLPNSGANRLERLRITGGFPQASTAADQGDGGGGILNQANLTVVDSEIVDNIAASTAAATALGGGIFNRGASARLTMTGSTVAENTVTSTDDAGADQRKGTGGGIASYTPGGTQATAPLGVSLTNVTISDNEADFDAGNPGQVGGIFTSDAGVQTPTTLSSVTITDNLGTAAGGMQVFMGTASGVIVAGNTDLQNVAPDCAGLPDSLGGNILGTTAGIADCSSFEFDGPNDLVPVSDGSPVDVSLGDLLPNEGPTRAHRPNEGSPAINRGGPCPTLDQRGLFRPSVPPCDSGSIEVGASPPPPPPTPLAPTTPAASGPTGQRAAALKKCKKKKKKSKKARKKCKKKALKLPL